MSLPDFVTSGRLWRWLLGLVILVVTGFLVLVFLFPGSTMALDSEPTREFSSDWYVVDQAGTQLAQSPVALPSRVERDLLSDGPDGPQSTVRIHKIVPDGLPYPVVLGFRSAHQKIKLYCDGQLLYSFGFDDPPLFGKSPGTCWNFIRLPQNSAGTELTLELSSPYLTYQGKLNEIIIGSKAALVFSLLREHALSFLLTLVVGVVGVVTLIAYLVVIRKDAKRGAIGREALYLGLFSIFVSVWLFGEGRLTQFFFIPPAANTIVTILAMLATPIPLLRYIACGRSPRRKQLLNALSGVLCVFLLVAVVLQATGIWDLMQQLIWMQLSIVCIAVVLLYTLFADLVQNTSRPSTQLMISLGLMVVAFGVELVMLYASSRSIGNVMKLGVLVFIGVQAYAAFQNISMMMHLSKLASVDSLTGCLNRTAYTQALQSLETEKSVGVIIGDINALKYINDNFGHSAGDDAIVRCGKCFSTAFGPLGKCYRIGGDEFALLGSGLTLPRLEEATKAFHHLAAQERPPYPFAVSIGYALHDPQNDPSLNDTIRRADKQMYQHKHSKC